MFNTTATCWIGTAVKVPVTGFACEPGRSIYDVETPAGDREVWVTQMRDDVMVNVYADGSRVFSADAEDTQAALEAAAQFVTQSCF